MPCLQMCQRQVPRQVPRHTCCCSPASARRVAARVLQPKARWAQARHSSLSLWKAIQLCLLMRAWL